MASLKEQEIAGAKRRERKNNGKRASMLGS